tara:strand:+ start:7260 stop:7577 length:318 start_codon:yes stop_codon:yes gene_type:complete
LVVVISKQSAYNKRMNTENTKQDIEKAIAKATAKVQGGQQHWYERLPKEALPFINTLADRVENHGQKANARVVSEILMDKYNFAVSRSRVRLWLVELEKRNAEKN